MNTLEPRRATWLQNLVVMVLVLAGVNFLSNIQSVGKEVFSHLGKGFAGWAAYIAVMGTGALIALTALAQSAARFKGPGPRPTWREIIGSFLIVGIVGVFGYTLGDELQGEVRLKMTEGHWTSVTLGNWPDLQGSIGWMVAMFAFLGVWATVAQVLESWRTRNVAGQQSSISK